jgi:CheY-like chemotaxis protein
MPGMDGGEVAAAIRQDETVGRTAIVMLTSVDNTSDGRAFRHLDIQGHLVKPARTAVLLQTMIEALQAGAVRNVRGIAEETEPAAGTVKTAAS